MVISYLEKLKKEYYSKRQNTESKIEELQLSLKENEKFIKILREKNDFNFESFTPRNLNDKDKIKIQQLLEEQERIRSSIQEEERKCTEYADKINELDCVMDSAKSVYLTSSKNEKAAEEEINDEFYRIKLLETQENERQRISRELHDYTVQNLTSLIHRTELCSKLVDMDVVRCKLELNTMIKILREIISDTRQMIYNLHPMSFDDIGLDVTIERALDKLEVEGQTKKIHFYVEGESYQLKPVIGITILRIIQEACSNSICHANCSNIQVHLKYDSDQITVQICDNGDGFYTDEISNGNQRNKNSGFGLAMMKERVYLLSGNIEINSEIGTGTNIIVHVPVNKEEV